MNRFSIRLNKINLVYLLLILALNLNFIFLISYFTNHNSDIEYDSKSLSESVNLAKKNNKFLFCMILTTPKGFKTEKSQIVLNIWASKCDNFKFVALLPDETTSSVNQVDNKTRETLEFNRNSIFLKPEGLVADLYKNLTNKVYLAFKQIYKEFNDYDWYLKADDDTFIHMDNLREFLLNKNPREPVTYGHEFKLFVRYGYHSGGAGYLLSNEALTRFGSRLNTSLELCPNSGIEDIDVATCLRDLGVYPEKTVDELERERFSPLNIMNMYTGYKAEWLANYSTYLYKKVKFLFFFKFI